MFPELTREQIESVAAELKGTVRRIPA